MPKGTNQKLKLYRLAELMLEKTDGELIIPGLSEPPVRTLGATIPENESHMFR